MNALQQLYSAASRNVLVLWLLASGFGLLSAGCSLPLPQAQADPTKFYVLSVSTESRAVATPVNAPAVRLRPVDVASYLRSRPLAVRHGPNEIEFREFARWGEPLEQGIARVLREELLARGAASSVQTGLLRPSDVETGALELTVRVVACEGDADGAVDFEAVWELRTTDDNPKVVARDVYRPTQLRWSPKHEATLAAGLSEAVAGLAGDIAAHLAK